MNDMLNVARRYLAAGLCPIPVIAQTKVPDVVALAETYGGDVYQDMPRDTLDRLVIGELPNDADLVRWFGGGTRHVGIATGNVSGNLVVFDLDDPSLYRIWHDELRRLDTGLTRTTALTVPVVRTGNGYHIYLRVERPISVPQSGPICGGRGSMTLSDVRGQGGWVVAPPSRHPNGKAYALIVSDLDSVPIVPPTVVERFWLAATFGSMFRTPLAGDAASVGLFGTSIQVGVRDDGAWCFVDLSLAQARGLRDYLNRFGHLFDAMEQARERFLHQRYLEAIGEADPDDFRESRLLNMEDV